MIDKYLYPKWLTRIMNGEFANQHIAESFPDRTILKLRDPETSETNDYIVVDCRGYYNENGNPYWLIMTNRDVLRVEYNKDDKRFPIIKRSKTHLDTKIYEIILDINPEWEKQLQLSRLRLAFAMSQNERLGENSLLNNIPLGIIECIGENIKTLVYDVDYYKEMEEYDELLRSVDLESKGGGKKKKRKSKKKKRATKRRKSKRKKHKTKRRKS